MKMYILVKDTLTPAQVAVTCAHASLACHLTFGHRPDMKKWLSSSFKKCICVLNAKEFERAREHDDVLVMTESSLNNAEVSIVCCPREEWPKEFKYYKLYK